MADEYTHYQSVKNGYTYEHFPVVCPTCEGRGEIDDCGGSGMVTFVPVKDERLKPAWLKLKIALLVLSITLAVCIATYFLYPRKVTIDVTEDDFVNFNFDIKYPYIAYRFLVVVKNDNFFGAKLENITLQVDYEQVIVGKTVLKKPISAGARSTSRSYIVMNVTYDSANTGMYIKKQCHSNRDYVPQLLLSSGVLSYWMHDQNIENEYYFFTDCERMIFPLPIKPTTTVKTTTTTTTTKAVTTKALTTSKSRSTTKLKTSRKSTNSKTSTGNRFW